MSEIVTDSIEAAFAYLKDHEKRLADLELKREDDRIAVAARLDTLERAISERPAR